ncbi:hypothetical protein J3R82DRAFT_6871 [Butyriboletus roseoflavus]|nr:hypothetical protein J3R82DRAFT_6871 [Butyriboletus roseoflavus]
MLDAELDKVEKFYVEREKKIHEHAKQLREQLNKLRKHHQMYHVTIAYVAECPELDTIYIFVAEPVVLGPYQTKKALSDWCE